MSGIGRENMFKIFSILIFLKVWKFHMTRNTTQQKNILIPNPKYRLSSQMILPQSETCKAPSSYYENHGLCSVTISKKIDRRHYGSKKPCCKPSWGEVIKVNAKSISISPLRCTRCLHPRTLNMNQRQWQTNNWSLYTERIYLKLPLSKCNASLKCRF